MGCYVEAILFHADCEAAATECIAEAEPVSQTEDCQLDREDVDDLPPCASSVTVGEFETCIAQTAEGIRDALDDLSCDLDVTAIWLPPACAEIEAKCPGLVSR